MVNARTVSCNFLIIRSGTGNYIRIESIAPFQKLLCFRSQKYTYVGWSAIRAHMRKNAISPALLYQRLFIMEQIWSALNFKFTTVLFLPFHKKLEATGVSSERLSNDWYLANLVMGLGNQLLVLSFIEPHSVNKI